MKDSFKGYYSPRKDEYERIWSEGLIVLDTNVLLNLYRLPPTTRDEFLSVLELLKARLWIPHQVALEFQRNRLAVISAERKSTEAAVSAAKGLFSELKQKVDALEIDKHGIGVAATPLIKDLEKANKKLLEAIEAVHQSRLDIADNDPIRERLDNIISGKVGSGPANQQELDALAEGGEDRFAEKIPPGFADVDKSKNPNETTFIHDHLKYQRKFGDLILWRQLIQHVKDTDAKAVLLVTADRKEDWWWREQGKTIGPHPELIREICREGSVELFWMYSAAQFIEYAPTYTSATVSSKSVEDLQQVLKEESEETLNFSSLPLLPTKHSDVKASNLLVQSADFSRETQKAVSEWVGNAGGWTQYSPQGFPDFLVQREDGIHGYEVQAIFRLRSVIQFSRFKDAVNQGHLQLLKGELSSFTLVIVAPPNWNPTLELSEAQKIITRVPIDHPQIKIVFGTVKNGVFFPIIEHSSEDIFS